MVYFITYSNDLYAASRDYSVKKALKKGGVDVAIAYKPEDIDVAFREKHIDILKVRQGNGLWLWKSYFLYKTLQNVSYGDVVLYCDAGSYFFRSCKDILLSMKDDIWVSEIPLIEKQFTKPELFDMMNCHGKKYTDTNQVQANFIAVRKTERGLKFAKEWLDWCLYPDALNNVKNNCPNEASDFFLAHRMDQSVLSLLAKKWTLSIHQDPSQYGRVPEKYYSDGRIFQKSNNSSEYKPCIILHREKRPVLKTCLKQWLCTWIPHSVMLFCSKPYRQAKRGVSNEKI